MVFIMGLSKGYRLVADFPPINSQCKLVPGSILNPEIEGENYAGAVAIPTMDYLQGYCSASGGSA